MGKRGKGKSVGEGKTLRDKFIRMVDRGCPPVVVGRENIHTVLGELAPYTSSPLSPHISIVQALSRAIFPLFPPPKAILQFFLSLVDLIC